MQKLKTHQLVVSVLASLSVSALLISVSAAGAF